MSTGQKSELQDVEQQESRLILTSPIDPQLVEKSKHWCQKTVLPYLVLVLLQFTYAGYQILIRMALVQGVNPLSFTFFRNLAAAVHTWNSESAHLLWVTVLGNQQLFITGLKLTSPLFAAVSQNTIPVITFLLAAVIGLEKITLRKTSGLAKFLGTVICITGAVIMTLYKGVAIYSGATDLGNEAGNANHGVDVHLFKHTGIIPALPVHFQIGHWALGALCLLFNCTSWGFYLIIQGSVMRKYPAFLSMECMVELFGSMQASVLGVALEGTVFLDVRTITMNHLVCILCAGIASSAINLVVQAWCIQRVSPFIDSLSTPVQALVVAFLTILLLGETLYLGILAGAVLIIGGFYIVNYGQRLERHQRRDTKQSDLRVPLLP